jgi:hypothetical protein
MNDFLRGAIAMACVVAGLFFLRFWRGTRDRFFLAFALAFWTLGAVRLALAITRQDSEAHTYFYFVRLAAFLLIILAIVDKNRSAGCRPAAQDASRGSAENGLP